MQFLRPVPTYGRLLTARGSLFADEHLDTTKLARHRDLVEKMRTTLSP